MVERVVVSEQPVAVEHRTTVVGRTRRDPVDASLAGVTSTGTRSSRRAHVSTPQRTA